MKNNAQQKCTETKETLFLKKYIDSLSKVTLDTKSKVSELCKGVNITKNGLTFIPVGNSYICKELASIPENFNLEMEDAEKNIEFVKDYETYINSLREKVKLRKTSKDDEIPDDTRTKLGQEIFDSHVAKLKELTAELSPFNKLLFWLSDYWWYYNIDMKEKVSIEFTKAESKEYTKLSRKYLLDILPSELKSVVKDMRLCNVAAGFGHFAIQFSDDENLRRIITDSETFELKNAKGYVYLDILPNGKPVSRFVTNRGGGRGFFDGTRYMAHDDFQTCAPKTTIIDGGYKVNSTECTIINGKLYPLVEEDDKVAHTTGAFMGYCDFSANDAIESIKLGEQSSNMIYARGDEVRYIIGDRIMKPIGYFAPSNVKLMENGFCRYDFSEYHEANSYAYEHIIAIDDLDDFLGKLSKGLSDVEDLKTYNPKSKESAVEYILKNNPEAALLDMHLSGKEEFEGLWMANELVRQGFKGQIIITSGYPKDKLKAMKQLINYGNVHTPGKDMSEIKKCLTRKCNCL